ncbi:hypothetical protein BC831DRAFT_467707 [Entophlyctis helioformis]|nr:hypothetical protein BC831DRAFT_467707 [Entophlyctis helioformis]
MARKYSPGMATTFADKNAVLFPTPQHNMPPDLARSYSSLSTDSAHSAQSSLSGRSVSSVSSVGSNIASFASNVGASVSTMAHSTSSAIWSGLHTIGGTIGGLAASVKPPGSSNGSSNSSRGNGGTGASGSYTSGSRYVYEPAPSSSIATSYTAGGITHRKNNGGGKTFKND